ncbi:unnamed protein product, partial [Rotaria magnacalcarata]
ARFGRSPVPGRTKDIHSNTQWLPNAEEYRMSMNFYAQLFYLLF